MGRLPRAAPLLIIASFLSCKWGPRCRGNRELTMGLEPCPLTLLNWTLAIFLFCGSLCILDYFPFVVLRTHILPHFCPSFSPFFDVLFL